MKFLIVTNTFKSFQKYTTKERFNPLDTIWCKTDKEVEREVSRRVLRGCPHKVIKLEN